MSPRLASAPRKSFGPTRALAGVDFDAAAGEVHALVGENGAGKSTLMKILAGALRPDEGEMALDGSPYRPSGPLDAAARGVAMVYQELSLVPHLGAAENIVLGREPARGGLVDRERMRRTCAAAMAVLGHPDVDLDVPVRRLPVAVQQVVEIARAITRPNARVLILDEPTSSLARRRRRAALRHDRPPAERGAGDHLHLARPRGSAGDRGPRDRAPRRRDGGRGAMATSRRRRSSR